MAQVMGEKQRKLQEASETNRRLQAKMKAFSAQQDADRARKQQTIQQLAGQLEREEKGDSQPSKLDVILAQSVQMQTLLLAQMTNQHGTPAAAQGRLAQPGQASEESPEQFPSVSPQELAQANAQMMHEMAFNDPAADGPSPDEQLMAQMRTLMEMLEKGDESARLAAAEAVKTAAEQYAERERVEAGKQPEKKKDSKPQPADATKEGVTDAEKEADLEEEFTDDGDEILPEEVMTYDDIALAWLRKATRVVISNVMVETFNLDIRAPFKGGLFKKGLAAEEVESRVLKLGVRLKGLVTAVKDAMSAKDMPEPLITFLRRLVAHRQGYPLDLLIRAEKLELGLPVDGDADADDDPVSTRGKTAKGDRDKDKDKSKSKLNDTIKVNETSKESKGNESIQRRGTALNTSVNRLKSGVSGKGGREGNDKDGEKEEDKEPAKPRLLRAGLISSQQARFLQAHFLWIRALLLKLVLEPWKHNIGGKPGTLQQNNLKVIAWVLYHCFAYCLGSGDVDRVQDKAVLDAMGVVPGDKEYMVETACEELIREVNELLLAAFDQVLALCFPEGRDDGGGTMEAITVARKATAKPPGLDVTRLDSKASSQRPTARSQYPGGSQAGGVNTSRGSRNSKVNESGYLASGR